VPFILASTIAAWLGMNDIADAKASFAQQSVIFGRTQNWLMCVLYIGTFGSFIGYSAGFPLLSKIAFPDVNALQYVFLGPLVGALSRAGTGWVADRFGGGRVTFWVFAGMIASVLAVIFSLQAGSFPGFFAGFIALFFFTGVGNASTFQMIPVIMGKEVPRLMPQLTGADRARQISGQLNGELEPPYDWTVKIGDQSFEVSLDEDVTVNGEAIDLALEYTPGDRLVQAEVGDTVYGVKVEPTRSGLRMTTRGAIHTAQILPARVAHLTQHMIEKVPPDLSKFLICKWIDFDIPCQIECPAN